MDKFKKGDVIDGKTVGEIVYEFEILSSSYEMDSTAWVVLFTDESKHIVFTKKDKPYIAKWIEIDEIVENIERLFLI
jgi:hypothetical protein